MRWARLLALLLLVAVVAAVLWRHRTHGSDAVRTVTVGRGDIVATVHALGTIRPRTAVDVGAQVSGQIVKLHVAPGDAVTRGQLLAEIDPAIPQATVEAGRAELAGLRAQLAEQEAQLDLARRQYDRQLALQRENLVPAAEVDVAAAAFHAATARIDNLRAQIDQIGSRLRGDEAQLGFTRIYAPIAGTVVSVDAKEGQTLNATYQTPAIMRLADLGQMTIWTEVSEADIRRIRPGMSARFTTLGDDDRTWTGTVRQVLPAPVRPAAAAQAEGEQRAGGKVVLYTVLLDVDNADGALLPEMTAQVTFITAAAHAVLVAPLAALAERRDAPGLYTARVIGADGRVEEREVRGGTRDRMSVEVLDGLSEGERLLLADEAQP